MNNVMQLKTIMLSDTFSFLQHDNGYRSLSENKNPGFLHTAYSVAVCCQVIYVMVLI